MESKEVLKKQIIYRSSHRGSKEMDLLLGNFVKKNIDFFSDSELKDLDNLVKIEDDIIVLGRNRYKVVPRLFNKFDIVDVDTNEIIDLKENKLLKENITQFEEYIDGMFNASVDQEAEEGFQTGVWAKEEEGNPELYDETEKFDALVDYLANIGGKATLEGNPDINVELLDNGDIKWSADVTLY